jgi:hypothetical protein
MTHITNQPNALKLLMATPAVAKQEFLLEHRKWMEESIACPLSDAVIFEFHLPFDHLVLSQLFTELPVDGRSVSYTPALRPIIEKWATPPDAAPHIELGMSRDRAPGVAKGKFGWELTWKDTPLAIWLKGVAHPLIYCSVPFTPHTDQRGPYSKTLLVVNKLEMTEVLRILETIEPPKRIRMMEGRDILLPCDGYNWDSLALNPDLERYVRQDFESFFRREEWFRRHNIPYRRGYLFYGPPGNGKTSAARVMACHSAIRAFGVDFRMSRDTPYSPDQLSDLFDAAADHAPSLIILEDIDKAGAGDPEALRSVISGLLSCMDGLSSSEGVIVVATANDPTHLTNALLKRPGRFDRVANFPLPTPDLRGKYLVHISGGLLEATVAAKAALTMDRFSFAQVREAYVLAGQLAFESDGEITAQNLAQAAKKLRQEGKHTHAHGQNGKVGFSVDEEEPAFA